MSADWRTERATDVQGAEFTHPWTAEGAGGETRGRATDGP